MKDSGQVARISTPTQSRTQARTRLGAGLEVDGGKTRQSNNAGVDGLVSRSDDERERDCETAHQTPALMHVKVACECSACLSRRRSRPLAPYRPGQCGVNIALGFGLNSRLAKGSRHHETCLTMFTRAKKGGWEYERRSSSGSWTVTTEANPRTICYHVDICPCISTC